MRLAMKSVSLPLALMGALILPAPASHASTISLFANLTGPNESPPNASPGIGTATVVLDTTAHTFFVSATFSGLLGTTTASHIHCCTTLPGVGTAGVATQVPAFIGFPLGVTSGSFSNTFSLLDSATYNPAFLTSFGGSIASADAAFEAGLLGGTTYYNIHTSVVPGGEIRGFLAATPVPAALPLFAGGLALMGFIARRRKRKGAVPVA
jgi:hypothetical protein